MIRRGSRGRLFDGAESIRRNTLFTLAMKIGSAIFTGALTLFLVRYLGPGEYGVYALAISVGSLLLVPADVGVSRSAARFIAERRGEGSEIAAVLRHAITLKAIGVGTVAGTLAVLAGPIADAYGVPELKTPLRIVALALIGQSFVMLVLTTFEALGRSSLGFRLASAESALEASSSIALVLAGAGVAGAVGGRAIGYGVAAVVGLLLLLGGTKRGGPSRKLASGMAMRTIATYAGALFVIDVAFAAFAQIDVLLIGAFLDPRSAGYFSAPAQILTFTSFASLALAAGVAPRLARAPGREPDVASFQSALRLVVALQFAMAVPFVVWAQPITELLLGPDFAESADIFRALGPYILLFGPGGLLALGINYLGEARRRVPLAISAIAINAAIDVVLIPKIGIVAGAIGTDVAYLYFFVGHLVICRRLIDLRLRPLALTLLRAALAAAFMAAVLFAFGTSSLSAVELVSGALLGLIAYGLTLVATGEIRPEELARAREAMRRTS